MSPKGEGERENVIWIGVIHSERKKERKIIVSWNRERKEKKRGGM